ncbi:MAG TPA: hypothetical protein ENK85_11780 [Saprospiraceae bacterium]|nr:hypothetical protein [Saprospiraceae bacterium]
MADVLQKTNTSISDDNRLFEELKETLLREDREALQRLQDILDQPEKLSHKMSPVLEKRLSLFKEAFPKEYKAIIEKIIAEKLANSKEELLEAIYPIMGKLIKKYISLQFQLLRESIDQKMKFSIWHKIKTKSKVFFTGVKSDEIILGDLIDSSIENVFIIQKHSGLLIASTNDDPTLHDDLIAGMMTAIKSFAEDAFDKNGAELEVISYDNYQLLLESYYSYYFVVAVTGNISSAQNAKIHEKMNTFARKNLNRNTVKTGQFSPSLSIKLKSFFLSNPLP